MAYDKSTSPVDWYYGSYLLRFAEMSDSSVNDPERKFLAWENTILVKAASLDEAYDKVETIGRQFTRPYRGGERGVPVQWHYEGITELLPIYEALEDGVEIAWTDLRNRKLKTLRRWIRSKEALLRRQ